MDDRTVEALSSRTSPHAPETVLQDAQQRQEQPHFLLPPPIRTRTGPTSRGRLHLLPCTSDQFLDLDDPDDRYELVDGILVSREMSDKEHTRIAQYLKRRLVTLRGTRQAHISVYCEAKVQILTVREALSASSSNAHPPSDASPASSSSSSSSTSEKHTERIADLAIARYRSKAEQDTDSPTSKKVHFPRTKDPPLLVVEVTSDNRNDDLEKKWIEYARTGVKEYVIVDRAKKCVILGKLDSTGTGTSSGDPDIASLKLPRRSARHEFSARRLPQMYVKRVLQEHEKIDCSFLRELNLSVRELLDAPPEEEVAIAEEDARREQIRQKDEQIRQKDEQIRQKDEQNRQKDEQNRQKDEEIEALQQELRRNRQRDDRINCGNEGKMKSPTDSPTMKKPKRGAKLKAYTSIPMRRAQSNQN